MDARYDVVVIGGGAAGLSGALTLARARRRVLVIDSGQPRNAPADGVHVYLGREGTPPRELLATGREEVRGYGGEIVTGTVTTAERMADGRFRVVLADGSAVEAARLLVATGLVDELPEVPGLAELWGHDVLHCPYCHGWEVRDQPIGVIGGSPLTVHQALLWRQWSDDVTLFHHTAPELSADERERLAARGVTVVEGLVSGLETDGGRLTGVRLADGRLVPRRALAVATRLSARAGVLTDLGLKVEEQEMGGHAVGTGVAADPSGATSVPGVWVAGNVTSLVEQVIGSAAAGVRAGAAINADLIAAETSAAVTAHRTRSASAHAHHADPASGHAHHADPASGHAHHAGSGSAASEEEFWDARYSEKERIWSGNPNVMLVREITDLAPGTALDLGCGEGADAIWLARRGWRVTAADISGVALGRAAEQAEAAGVADRIDWQRHDLARSFPAGTFDLVAASFLHSPVDLPREGILRTAAAAVAPGGVLLVIGHAGWPSWEHEPLPGVHFPTPQDVLDALELPEGEWEVQLSEEYERTQNAPDGAPGTRNDNVLKLRRLP
ncbi:FAD-dependent oxidoreductase [Nonomuraea jiangxiensis]|uniref:Thioredoxin reductase n=1 Tax=Nonomuraea jiangxiensis TaxID=633440 RepID=A0A1G9AQF2_9ACTN|nr:Thioredoxin reductase [Nonomuraea jiangxiensis]